MVIKTNEIMEEKKTNIVKGIRACLISTKGMISLRQLEKDYYTMMGERIPFTTFGFKNLAEFIKSEQSLATQTINGETFVDARVSEKSSHISTLVNKQKTAKRKDVRKGFSSYTPPPRLTPSTTPTTKWRPKCVVQDSRKYQRSHRPAAVSHNQFVNNPKVASKVVIPEHSTLNTARNIPPKNKKNEQNHEIQRSQITDLRSRLNMNGSNTSKTTRNLTTQISRSSDQLIHDEDTLNPCTSLMSTRKRITRKMSEINLEKDSGISSPMELVRNYEAAAPITPKVPELTDDPISDLENMIEAFKLDKPVYETKIFKTKRNNFVSCILKVGKHIYQSYPTEFKVAKEAEKYVADLALEDLPIQYGKKPSLLLSNDRDILERIPPMLEKHSHGIWDWQLKLDYKDKYNEELTPDWLKIIDMSPNIQLEKCSENYVVMHCKPGDKGTQRSTIMTLSDVSVPTNTVNFADGKLHAEVTYIMSVNEIWCRQHATEEALWYNDMIGRMELYYERYGNQLKTENVTIGGYYVTKYENYWYRVRAIKEENTEVFCFFIDDGDELSVSKSDLYQLKREFATAQAQAFVCRLVGLEDLYEVSQNSETLQTILYKHVLLELANDAKNIDDDVTLPVVMYDVETGDSINEHMISLLSFESAKPEIQKDTATEVYVSNIESNGDVYVQIHSAGYERLQTLLMKLEEDIIQNPPIDVVVTIKKEDSIGKLYFAKFLGDGHWRRIQIIDWSPCETLAQIYYVDFGNTEVIKVNKDIIYPLDNLSDVLNLYPFQAVKVKMAISEIPEDFVDLARKDMPVDQPILLKVLSYDEYNIPQVEFFKRNVDGGLFCINKSISMGSELRKNDSNNNKKKHRLSFDNKNVPSSGKLQSPVLPEKNSYFEVHVPFAVNPYNFFVQPLNTQKQLNEMMDQLQKTYKDVLYSPLTLDQVIPGNIYASKHEDGNWYRTSVIKVIHARSISVFYCDFGYYATLTVQELIPLDIEFMQLPYQALKARLARVKPKNTQWTMGDCDIFKEMVESKSLYSILVDVDRDELHKEDVVLNLDLIDTTHDEDVLIANELISRGVAVVAQD